MSSSLSITTEKRGPATIVHIAGRLDAHGSGEAEPSLDVLDSKNPILVDLSGVSYLSSGGIRIFVSLQKRVSADGGRLILAALQPYCREVLWISGLNQFFTILDTIAEALAELGGQEAMFENACGKFTFHPGEDEPGYIDVLGSIQNVLEASVTPELVWEKKFSSKEYSLGLGALGPTTEDVMLLMGEMMTIGGTMVWLPTDGNDTPDYLVPRHDSDAVVIRTGFNASLGGRFNEYVEFESANPEGATMADLYAALFDFARQRRPDYRGCIGLAMRAEMGSVYGCGVVKAPIAANAPANGKLITDPVNYPEWFEFDQTPRHKEVTGLISGVGLDLEADLSVFNQKHLNDAFYINPGNEPGGRVKLHDHGVFFHPIPLGERPYTLEKEIARVVEAGDFIDMRHLFDKTTINWAVIGLIYVQDFRADPASAR